MKFLYTIALGFLALCASTVYSVGFFEKSMQIAKAGPVAFDIINDTVAVVPVTFATAQNLMGINAKLTAHINTIKAARTSQEKYMATVNALNDVVFPVLKNLSAIAQASAPIIQKTGDNLISIVNEDAGKQVSRVGGIFNQQLPNLNEALNLIQRVLAQQMTQNP